MMGRFTLAHTLEGHDGCVNTVAFDRTGSRLVSGSDDRTLLLWDLDVEPRVRTLVATGHRNNVFCAQFLGETTIASCAADGDVRLHEIGHDGGVATRLLARHRGRAHKLALVDGSQVVLSSGEDGRVFVCDPRCAAPSEFAHLGFSLNVVAARPLHDHHFCVAGDSETVPLFDLRRPGLDSFADLSSPLVARGMHATSAAWTHDGAFVAGNFSACGVVEMAAPRDGPWSGASDDDGRIFEGHVNVRTVKMVAYCGPRSEFVLSGSDCGHLFAWERSSGAVVNMIRADDNIVNSIAVHPAGVPLVAVSGIDSTVKILSPLLPAAVDVQAVRARAPGIATDQLFRFAAALFDPIRLLQMLEQAHAHGLDLDGIDSGSDSGSGGVDDDGNGW